MRLKFFHEDSFPANVTGPICLHVDPYETCTVSKPLLSITVVLYTNTNVIIVRMVTYLVQQNAND